MIYLYLFTPAKDYWVLEKLFLNFKLISKHREQKRKEKGHGLVYEASYNPDLESHLH